MDTANFAEKWDDFLGGLIDRGFVGLENITMMGYCTKHWYHYIHFNEGVIVYSNVGDYEKLSIDSHNTREWAFEDFNWDEFDRILSA